MKEEGETPGSTGQGSEGKGGGDQKGEGATIERKIGPHQNTEIVYVKGHYQGVKRQQNERKYW